MTTEPRERPILFSAPMVRSILYGHKTQTRRIIKPRGRFSLFALDDDGKPMWTDSYILDPGNVDWRMRECPYGAPGDRLWVRETCRAMEQEDGTDGVFYLADEMFRVIENSQEAADRWMAMSHYGGKRRSMAGVSVPAIHMPRWASRITLAVTDVRVQRLREISGQDAVAEGAGLQDCYGPDCPNDLDGCNARGCFGAREWYRDLWNTINGPGSWDANPFVWAITFERIK